MKIVNVYFKFSFVQFCYTYSNVDAWEVEQFGFQRCKESTKLRILKVVLSSHFLFSALTCTCFAVLACSNCLKDSLMSTVSLRRALTLFQVRTSGFIQSDETKLDLRTGTSWYVLQLLAVVFMFCYCLVCIKKFGLP